MRNTLSVLGLALATAAVLPATAQADWGNRRSYQAVDRPTVQNSVRTMESCRGPITIMSDDDVQNITSCNIIVGDLVFNGATSLEPLDQLIQVKGDLIIEGTTALETTAGLKNLHTVDGSIRILGNAALSEVVNLGRIHTVDAIAITDNPALSLIDAFSRIVELPGEVTVAFNTSLVDLDGFDRLREVSSIYIDNENLSVVSGFERLETIEYSLFLGYSSLEAQCTYTTWASLPLIDFVSEDCKGFDELSHIGSLIITGTEGLVTLNFLPSLERIERDLVLMNNTSLAEINQLREVSVGRDYQVSGNTNLNVCHEYSVWLAIDFDEPELVGEAPISTYAYSQLCSPF